MALKMCKWVDTDATITKSAMPLNDIGLRADFDFHEWRQDHIANDV